MAPPRPILHRGANMAAPSEGRAGREYAPFSGTDGGSFPFTVAQGEAEETPKKPCRACTDFKSWFRNQKNVHPWPGLGAAWDSEGVPAMAGVALDDL
uniref:Uncharacterized protein n=1 Tax=Serinus canaria TaxID=9135 RepID=A0A8C9MNJ3_SERCA